MWRGGVWRLISAVAVVVLVAVACGSTGDGSGEHPSSVEPAGRSGDASSGSSDSPALAFAKGSTMAALHERGSITIGTKYSSPPFGFLNPDSNRVEGFDPDFGRSLAKALGIDEGGIKWVETESKNRQPFIDSGKVDIVISTWGLTDDHADIAAFAGPYYYSDTRILVKKEDAAKFETTEDLQGTQVCAPAGSDTLKMVEDLGAVMVPLESTGACIDQLAAGQVEAVAQADILMYAPMAQHPDVEFEMVLDPLTRFYEALGIKKGDKEFCLWVADFIDSSFENGEWDAAYEANLAPLGMQKIDKPEIDRGLCDTN